MTKIIYINDLVHRYPSHTFTETTTDDEVLVQFKNAGSVLVAQARAQSSIVLVTAYQKIRHQLLKGETPSFVSTTTQRDALTGVDQGTQIYNITSGRDEVYTGSAWISAGGSGVMLPAAYGNMYENNESGSAMNSTTKRWITAAAGKLDGNGIVTFSDNATGDRLVIGTGGAGDYFIDAKCDQTNAGGNVSKMVIQVNGVDTIIEDEHASDSGDHRQLNTSNILTLADNDYLSMYVVSSTPIDVITAHHTSLTVRRLS